MKIIVTLSEVLDGCSWTDFCRLTGVDEYAIRAGKLDRELDKDREFELTLDQAVELDLVGYVRDYKE